MSVYSWMHRRIIGNEFSKCKGEKKYVASDLLFRQHMLWQNLYKNPNDKMNDTNIKHNGVFGIKYSPDGKLVVAACEKDAVVIVDPLTRKVIKTKEKAHTLRCNTVTFIDHRLFLTCSDDNNIALWDIRNMNEEVLLLKGHSSWVKNVEYHKSTQQVISAGFDDKIISWDINNPSPDKNCSFNVLMECKNLMRMKLSADGQSMYMSTIQTADLIAVHNLDIFFLSTDIKNISSVNRDSDHYVQYQNNKILYNRREQFDAQATAISRRNHLELYYGYNKDIEDNEVTTFCHSIDIHPENMAVVMRYDRLPSYSSKYISVHNTWSYYNGALQGNNAWSAEMAGETYLPLPRGQPTNFLPEDGLDNAEYIQEVSFSPCGRLLASPCGFGVDVLAFDKHIPDYRTHIAERVDSIHQWEEGSDTVYPPHITLNSKQLHGVAWCLGHKNLVLSTCFSPTHMQIATGSKDGHLIFFDVVL